MGWRTEKSLKRRKLYYIPICNMIFEDGIAKNLEEKYL